MSEATVRHTIHNGGRYFGPLTKVSSACKKALQTSGTVFEVVLVDVSKQPMERPHLAGGAKEKPKAALQR